MLTQKYEDLRQASLGHTEFSKSGLSVMRNQGMWAWIELVGNEMSPTSQESRTEPKILSTKTIQTLVSRPGLLDVWTDLLLGLLTAQEAR